MGIYVDGADDRPCNGDDQQEVVASRARRSPLAVAETFVCDP